MPKDVAAIMPSAPKEAWELAQFYCKTPWIKYKFKDPSSVFFAICYSLELGMTPAQGLLSLEMLKGKPVMGTDGLIALAYSSGKLEYLKEFFIPEDLDTKKDIDSLTAVVVLKRKDIQNETKYTFSVDDAKRAGLWRAKPPSPWATYPKRMLQIRARGFAVRDAFADVLQGLISKEEVNDYPPTAGLPEKQKEAKVIKVTPTDDSDKPTGCLMPYHNHNSGSIKNGQ